MGGKTGTTTSGVQIPPEVLARYNSVNASAQGAASTPFKEYSSDPNSFVAPLNQQQNTAIGNINQYANAAQTGYQAGMNTTGSAINQINAGQNVAQPYFSGAQTIAAGAIPQYQQASGLAAAAMTPLQQATYAAQPGYQVAQAGTMGAAMGTGQTIGGLGNISQGYNAPNYQAGVQGYMNPYVQNAMGSTAAMMQNQNRQQQQQLQGNAISSGAFGGDRGNISQAALMGQQNLAMGQTLGQMANTGYQAAAQNYLSGLGAQAGIAGQQGAMYGQMGNLANQYGQLGGQAQQALINAGQAQQAGAANIANIAGQGMTAAGQYGALGTAAQNAALQGVPLSLAAGAQQGTLGAGAQTAGLQGAQAQLGAGTLGQQTQQAGNTALYNQFLQQQAYPFQTAQFLANIAEGTGALSGSTTTATQPMSFFSDRRLKEDIKRVGTANNGLPIYKFKYKGDPNEQTHIGFMAQDVEKVHPEAVGLAGGYKTVDYDKASRPAHQHGGLVSEGGMVGMQHAGEGYADGGYADYYDPNSLQNIIARHQAMYANASSNAIPSARNLSTGIGVHGRVPEANLPVGGLRPAGKPDPLGPSAMEEGLGAVERAQKIGKAWDAGNAAFTKGTDWLKQVAPTVFNPLPNNPAPAGTPMPPSQSDNIDTVTPAEPTPNARGGRTGLAAGGSPTPEGLYSDTAGGTLDIPDQNDAMQNKLLQSSAPSGSMQDPTMKDLMAIAAMVPKAYGGRTGYDDGGTADDDVLTKYGPVIGEIESSNNYGALGPATKTGDRGYGKYQVMGSNIPSWTQEALGKPMSTEDFLASPEAQDQVFTHHFSKALDRYGTPEDAASVWFSGKPRAQAGNASDQLGTTVPSYVKKFNAGLTDGSDTPVVSTGLGAGNKVVTDGPDLPATKTALAAADSSDTTAQPAPDASAPEGGLVPRAKTYLPTPAAPEPGAFDYLANKLGVPKELQDSTFWGTIATGLGTMASSRSPFLGAAALEGLAGAAQAYPQLQRQKAEISATNAAAASTMAGIPSKLIVKINGVDSIIGIGPDGIMRPYNLQDATDLMQKGQLQMDPRLTSQYVQAHPEAASTTKQQPIVGTPVNALPVSLTPEEVAAAQDAQKKVALEPEDIRNQRLSANLFAKQSALADSLKGQQQNIYALGNSLAEIPSDTALGSGAYAPLFEQAEQKINSLAHAIGMKGNIWNGENLASAEEVNKVLSRLQGQQAQALDQHSYAALQSLIQNFPSLSNSPDGKAKLMADIMVQQQRELDKQEYFRQWQNASKPTNGSLGGDFSRATGEQATNSFNNHYDPAYYDSEKQMLEQMFKDQVTVNKGQPNEAKKSAFEVATSGSANKMSDASKKYYANTYGAPILRYFNIK